MQTSFKVFFFNHSYRNRSQLSNCPTNNFIFVLFLRKKSDKLQNNRPRLKVMQRLITTVGSGCGKNRNLSEENQT